MRGVTSSTNATSEKRLFQPALPMRGVTRGCGCSRPARRQISTRTPHAGSDAPHSALAVLYDPISTRTPHAGSDEVCLRHFLSLSSFQPALPMRGVTPQRLPASQICRISTRTPHAGSDPDAEHLRQGCAISTRTPHAGSDHHVRGPPSACRKFQPALPMRGVTRTDRDRGETPRFQPALPMRGVTCPSRNNPCQRR